MDKITNISKYLYALVLGLFGVQHFIYAVFVASLIPSWIPFHLFWVYFTGAAMIIAAISIIINVKARLSCYLVGIMIWVFILIVDTKILIDTHLGPGNITNTGKDICIASGAFVIAALLGIPKRVKEEVVF